MNSKVPATESQNTEKSSQSAGTRKSLTNPPPSVDIESGFGEADSDEWIPEEAYRVAHDFRSKCASQVSKPLMNTLLNDLNKIWRAREKKQISRIQNAANREVQFLRREVSFKKPYDQVMQEQDIKRLKAELKDCQAALRENVAVIKQERDGPNQGLNLVDSTVKYTNQIQMERRKLLKENEELKQRVAAYELNRRGGEIEREKFFEGASWACKQAVVACEGGVDKARTLATEYHAKLKECENDTFLRMRVADWLIDQSQRLVKEVRDENQQILENSIRSQAASVKVIARQL